MVQLRGRRILVTGASGLLGPALLEALLALGAEVVGVGRRKTALDALRARFGHHERLETAECDVTDPEGLDTLVTAVTRRAPLDGVVHAVGAYVGGAVEDMAPEDVRGLLDANVTSAVLVARAFGAHLLKRGDGRLVLIASEAGLGPDPGAPVYAATKAAVVALARSLDAAWGARGVPVDAVCPATLGEAAGQASPAAVARAVAWLLSVDAKGTGGSVLHVPAR